MSKPVLSRWHSAIRASSITIPAALALSACAEEAPVTPPEPTASTASSVEDPLPVMGPERVILGFGDSLMAGYQVEEAQGYPETLERALRGKGINARVIDAGVSGDTTAAGAQRIAFVLDNNADKTIDLAIIELGGNDLLRGIPVEQTRANLSAIIEEVQSRDIPIILMGMRAPPNLGADFVGQFDGIYTDLASQYGTALVPFFMEPLFQNPDLFQGDRVHPTAQGIEEMVNATVDDVAAALPEQTGPEKTD
ncbi:arylesterase [Aurantiacibacter rhizosphaerae]|uniref:Arylesterase n=1 Tax=Aurantiacibacter rhizosphaerae TaxID=2691582 RepID=A0A844XD81_9SPHN|nr:arylesterase [Aurantiacibacter rhizosphaerae]MWV27465.1 arylesterase [Aurantiacibacter rhizosphaerae]